MLNKLIDAAMPPHVLDDDRRGFQTARDTKIKSRKYVFVDKKLLDGSPKVIVEYLNVQLREGHISDYDYKIRDFISHLQNKKSIGSYFPVAKKGDDACISFKDTLLVFKDAEPDEVRKFIRDDSKYTHTFSIKTAQYHTYNEIRSIEDPDKFSFFGAAVKPKGSFSGKLYLRNEDYYDRKFFKGADFTRTEDNQNPHFHMGSLALTVYLTKEQAELAHIKLQYDLHDVKINDLKYNFIGINGGQNCAHYSNNFFKFLGFEGDFTDYYQIDELDDRDQGIFFYLASHYRGKYIRSNWSDVLDHAAGLWTDGESTFAKYMHDNTMWFSSVSSSLYNLFNFYGDKQIHLFAYNGDTSRLGDQGYECEDLNCQNDFGQTPLHISTFYGRFNFAKELLELGVDVDMQDIKGHSAIFYAAQLKPSKEKQLLLEEMLKMTSDINATDSRGEQTALTAAVIANDPDAVELLIENGANGSFVNAVGDNLMHIAIKKKAYKVIEALHKHNVNLIYIWNEEEQIPVVEIKKLDDAASILHDIDKLYDPSLVLSEYQHYHENIDLDFL